jgi:hypothetical protein
MTPARLLAADYVLGLMTQDTRRVIDAQRATDRALDAEISRVEALLARAPLDGVMEAGATGQANTLFARVLGQIAGTWDGNPWQQAWEGVEKRTLWDERSYLFRCIPGAHIPAHRHTCEERLVVLDGEILIGTRKYVAGDCDVSPCDSPHADAWVETPCLVLIQLAH